ncbi:MAG: proprotein convertase P-domain-containing protein, partial [Eudoraea sp.]|nr:proprotein convertase P-domain-containing protein [Eudoraea sp.]NNK30207.1 proprotein convertase P [Flavobacteriaceae bacterium]
MKTKLHLVLSISIFFFSFYGLSQADYWEKGTPGEAFPQNYLTNEGGEKLALFTLQESAFQEALERIDKQSLSDITIAFPDTEGRVMQFRVRETPVFAAALSAKYPEIRSFTGFSTGTTAHKIRFSYSHKGLQGMVINSTGSGPTFIEKVGNEKAVYAVYTRDDLSFRDKEFLCNTQSRAAPDLLPSFPLFDDQILRKYRIAVSTTGEYTTFHGGTVEDALAAINATLTRVNEVFESDLGVTLELVANNDLVVFTDAETDPYSGNLNTEVQNTLTSTIGSLNYDVGHLFQADNNGGNAGFIGSVCKDDQKGSAYSSSLNPQGDQFDIDYVAHELGHQFGANHTWSFESEGTQVQVEPASGSTIMGYAGIVQGNNVQSSSDPYFHYISIFQIANYLEVNSCAEELPLSNNPPVIQTLADYFIPKSTAFVLTGSASDPDTSDILTYTWEQIDDGVVTTETFGPENPNGANFRSLPPTTDSSRYFPRLSEVVQGNLTQTNPPISSAWDTVSDIEREMNFALTVRDNALGGGQVSSDVMKVEVVNNAGPFAVTSQETTQSYAGGSVQTVTWDVAGTDEVPIRAQRVDIYLSLDGGVSFPILLVEDAPNDGEQDILLPGTETQNGRFMVKASNNIFFAVNSSDFAIAASEIVMDFDALDYEVCQPNDLIIPFEYETYLGFAEEVTFSAPDAPPGLGVVFSPATTTAATPVTVTFSNTSGITIDNYPITITATGNSLTMVVPLDLLIFNNSFADVPLTFPTDGALDIGLRPTLQWEENSAYTSYQVEIATDAAFSNVVDVGNVIFNQFSPRRLLENTTYFWRVKPVNPCGEGTFSPAFSFTSVQLDCTTRDSQNLPLSISSTGTPVVTAQITLFDDLPIADVNVILDIEHSFLSDLIIKLISPAGTSVILAANSCGGAQDINAIFDDDGPAFSCGSNPGISGTVNPLGSLASFNGESTLGTWTLEVSDTAPADGGLINRFSLEICAEGQYRPDDDNDGVFDDTDDLC